MKKKKRPSNLPFIYRRAETSLDDAKMLYQWRMDPETRKNSSQTGKITFEAHTKWLKKRIEDKNETLLIAYAPIGTVRCCQLPDKSSEVYLSWTVCPRFRNMGIGRQMVKEIVGAPFLKRLTKLALIRRCNGASRTIAKAAGLLVSASVGSMMLYSSEKKTPNVHKRKSK